MPGAGPLMREDFPNHYRSRLPYINQLIGAEKWGETAEVWPQLFDIGTSTRMFEEFPMIGGFGLFPTMGENDAVTYDSIMQGAYKRFSHTLYGSGYQIGFMAAQHDLDGLIKRYAPAMARALKLSLQTIAADFWNGVFGTQLTADGQYVCDTDHTYIRGGGTWSNDAGATAIGHTALESALVAFKKMKDLNKQPQELQAQFLLIPPDLEPIVHELLRTDTRVDSANNIKSYISGKLTVIVWPFLSSTTNWFILSPKESRTVKWLWNIKPRTSSGFDFDREAAKTKTLFACSVGAIDPRGIYGSEGA